MFAKDYKEYRGDDIIFILNFKNPDGSPYDISGWTVFFTLKENITDTDDNAKIKKTVAIVNGLSGVVQFDLTSSETNDLKGIYYYDMQYKDTVGKIKTIQAGEMEFKEDVTRRTA